MDALTLTIESHAAEDLDTDATCDVTARSIRIGRGTANDWVLPDATRHISGHHLDIRFMAGAYVVHDCSTNGTFLNGSKERIGAEHVIADGDRIQVGTYVMHARLREMERPLGPTNIPPAGTHEQTPDLTQFRSQGGGGRHISAAPTGTPASDASHEDSALHIPQDDVTHHRPMPGAPSADGPFAETPAADKPTIGAELSKGPRGFGESFSDPTPAPVTPDPEPVKAPPAPDVNAPLDDLLAGFLEGAGIDDAAALQIPLRDLGRMLGQCARMGTREMMQMLQDRSAVKLFVAQEDRTMRLASGNNPMKFMLDPDQAFETMFVTPRDGYQTGANGFDNALTDIRKHQMAMMAAVQPAMADMLEGLAPKDIEAATGGGGGMLGGGARKCWDEYNKRWTTRAEQGENGMLDAFVEAFARRYSEALYQV